MHDSYKISLVNESTAAHIVCDVHHISRLLYEDNIGAGVCMFFNEFEQIMEVLASHDSIVDDVLPVVPEDAMYYCVLWSKDGGNDWVNYIFDGIKSGFINVISGYKDTNIRITLSKN